MELLRRALLIGCLLPGLWLLRLAPLDPLLTIVPVDFAARQREEAASVPEERKTEEQRRRAVLPLPVYVEELLQYNVFSSAGPEWDTFLRSIDELQQGLRNELSWRTSPDPLAGGGVRRYVFFRPDEEPMRGVLDKLAAGGGVTYVSFSRPGSDLHYRVDRRTWTRRDFRPGTGFGGRPAPPAPLLYPFRTFGVLSALAGLAFYVLLPGPRRDGAASGPSVGEVAALGVGLVLFVVPLLAVGGSVQALTRSLAGTAPCWLLGAVGVHLFARPGQNAPDPLVASARDGSAARALFLREGLVFLAMALGPMVFVVSASMVLWNR